MDGDAVVDVIALVGDATELVVVPGGLVGVLLIANAEVYDCVDVVDVDDGLVVDVCFTFQPTMAMAPAYEAESIVVVTVVQSFVFSPVEA